MSESVLAAATTIANEWRVLAACWHVVAAVVIGALVWRRVDAQAIAGVMALMAFSVATMAWWSGNPFNSSVFAASGVLMLAAAAAAIPAQLARPSRRDLAAGALMCAFGWVYPHFLEGPPWQYLYLAPLGLLPCPTLAFIIGVSLLTNGFGSKPWTIGIGALGMFYGLIGVFVLGVAIDWMLAMGAAVLLAQAVAPRRLLDDVTFDREKRHV